MRPELLASLEAAAVSYRLGMDAQAGEALAGFVDELVRHLGRPEGAALADELAPFLTETLAAQERGDALRMADVLMHEVRPRLCQG